VGAGLCAVHDPKRKRNTNKITRPAIIVEGAVIGGCKVLNVLDETYAELECGDCCRPFIRNRSSIHKARVSGRPLRCDRCSKQEAS
jgi:hypothetical protein